MNAVSATLNSFEVQYVRIVRINVTQMMKREENSSAGEFRAQQMKNK